MKQKKHEIRLEINLSALKK